MTDSIIWSEPSLKTRFEALLPTIIYHLKMRFRAVRCGFTKADFVAEGVALCWQWFKRAVALGKDPATFVVTMATFAARKVRSGGTLCGQQPARDAMSLTARIKHGVFVEPLESTRTDHETLYGQIGGQRRQDTFEEALAENTVTPIPDQVVFRVDWPEFMKTLAERDRRMIAFLAQGNTTKAAAEAFHISPARVSQLRREWCEQWAVWAPRPRDEPETQIHSNRAVTYAFKHRTVESAPRQAA
jgi:hypothetical protein